MGTAAAAASPAPIGAKISQVFVVSVVVGLLGIIPFLVNILLKKQRCFSVFSKSSTKPRKSLAVASSAAEFVLQGAEVTGGIYLQDRLFVSRISDILCWYYSLREQHIN